MVDFCKSYLVVNREAFCDSRLHLIINDARFFFSLFMSVFVMTMRCHFICVFCSLDQVQQSPLMQLVRMIRHIDIACVFFSG